jgi:hypothetical protein
MARQQFSAEQIIQTLREAGIALAGGMVIKSVYRQRNFTDKTSYTAGDVSSAA